MAPKAPYIYLPWHNGHIYTPFNGPKVVGIVKCHGRCGIECSIFNTSLDCDKFFEAAMLADFGKDGRNLSQGLHVHFPPADRWVCSSCNDEVQPSVRTKLHFSPAIVSEDTFVKKITIRNEMNTRHHGMLEAMKEYDINMMCGILKVSPQECVRQSYASYRKQWLECGYASDQVDLYLYDRLSEHTKAVSEDAHIAFAQNLLSYGICNEYRTIPVEKLFSRYFRQEHKFEIYEAVSSPTSASKLMEKTAYAALYFKRDDDVPAATQLHGLVRHSLRYPIRKRLLCYLILNTKARKLIEELVTTDVYIPRNARTPPNPWLYVTSERFNAKRAKLQGKSLGEYTSDAAKVLMKPE